jgi:HK97 family phage major capsid protein
MSIGEKIIAAWKRVQDAKDKAASEGRDLTPDELTAIDSICNEIEKLEAQRKIEERVAATAARLAAAQPPVPRPEPTVQVGEDRAARRPWESFGHFLQAVAHAARSPYAVDPRLLPEQRAISGMSETVPADGGFTVQKDYVAELLKRTYETGVILPRCRRLPIGAGSNGLKINAINESSRATGSRWGGVQVYWLAEGGTPTAKAPKFRQMELELKKLVGLCYATDELLADATALSAVITDAFREEFAFVIDNSIIRGSGAGQPLGVLEAGCLITQDKEAGQAAATFVYENALKMWSRMWARSRLSAVWLIEQSVEPQLYSMSLAVGTAGAPVFLPAGGAAASPYATLFGRPVVPVEFCAALGTVGDVLLGDFSQYLIAEKGGLQADSSMHVRFVNDEMTYRFILRIDGQPIWNTTLTPFSAGSTLSPFVVLQTRS